ncbi:NACHT domain-containing protein [Phytohabitans sp. ZYX-F-186]|uniref:NACHT domain-containing protein n=1 Tax=Phytohabitans maris TaxID=3071409 RepID=A0ABU0ZAA3_9ACTN|nr:NACHT domain-containing protein [Phytohabitans sp. ZYX-F-186]MDQ7903986.1 NACHT domain-containing protein [Phytohabitans sp. ZYX-F-186]
MTDPIIAVVRALQGAAAGPAKKRALRSPDVVGLLSKLGLAGEVPPADFRGVYARALVEHCAGKPRSVVRLLADEWVRSAFERSFAGGDWDRVRAELRDAVERNRETGEFGHLHNRDVDEIDGFIAVFERLVAATRDPAHVATDRKLDIADRKLDRADRKLDSADRKLDSADRKLDRADRKLDRMAEEFRAGLGRIEQVRQNEEEARQAREPERREATPLERLESDIADWLAAVNHPVLVRLDPGERAVGWVVRAPVTPGRYARVVLVGVDGELLAGQVKRALEEKERQGAQGVWLVARRRISTAAEEAAATDGSVLCLTFEDLVDMAADFEPYVEWLDREVERLQLPARYVPLSCHRDDPDGTSSEYPWRDGGLDRYAARWLADTAREHLSVLGEFGSGKSWFSLHLAWQLSKAWRAAREERGPRPRLPLLIPLRDYAKAADVGAVVYKFLSERNIALNERVFDYLNRTGRLLLIFDGFDEMAARVDRQTMVANFWELAKVTHPGTKVLLSGRTEHFPDADETRRLLGGEVYAAVVPPEGETPRFDVVEISPLDDEQIGRMIRGRTADEEVVAWVTGDPGLRDLLRRPVMSDLVLTALPEIQAGEPVDLSHVYLYAIRHKLDEDIKAERTFTSRADKLYFLCELAWEMESTSALSMHYRLFPERLRAYFGAAVAERDLDHWEHDMRAQTLLNRDAAGEYTPAHRSLLEWFVAYKFAAELGVLGGAFLDLLGTVSAAGAPALWSEYFADRRPDGTLPPLSGFTAEPMPRLARTFGRGAGDPAVAGFLRSMVAAHPEGAERLLAIARATGAAGVETGLVGANCVLAARLPGERLRLAGANLIGLVARKDELSLAGADLRDTDLTMTVLGGVDLRGANLTGARLNTSRILGSGVTVDGVVVTDGGTIVADTSEALYAWDGGDLGRPPRRLATPARGLILTKSRSILPLGGDRFYGGPRYQAIVDAGTGHMTPVAALRAAWPIRWRGAPALLVGDPYGDLAVHNRSDLAVEAALPSPSVTPRKRRFGHIAYDDSYGVCHVAHVDGEVVVERFDEGSGRWEALARWRLAGGRLGFLRDTLWCRADDDTVLLCDLTGTPIWQAEGFRYYQERPEILVRPGKVVLTRGSGRIECWPLPAGPARWQVTAPLDAYALTAHPDGESFLYATAAGEFVRRRIENGELMSRAILTARLRGATFSRDCGLDEAALDMLAASGAILV